MVMISSSNKIIGTHNYNISPIILVELKLGIVIINKKIL